MFQKQIRWLILILCGSVSFGLFAQTAPTITSQPKSLIVTNGATVSFIVSDSGTQPLACQWLQNGTNLTDGAGVTGSATTNLTLSAVLYSAAANYSIIITNTYGRATSSIAKLSLILPAYTPVDLGTLGGDSSYAYGVNGAGRVVGSSYTAGDAASHAFLYTNGVMADIGTLGGGVSRATAINASGQIVGYSYLAGNSVYHAFLYTNGVMADIGTLGGHYSVASGINASGQVVGYSYLANDTTYHAFLYTNGVMADIGTLGGTPSVAASINNSGQIVGYSYVTGNSTYHAFCYTNGVMADIGTLGGSISYASVINNSGQIVGTADTTGGNLHAFLYSGGTMQDLGTLGGDTSYAYGINSSGQVVGEAFTVSNTFDHVFLFSGGATLNPDGMLTTNPFGINYDDYSFGINDAGQIIANANNQHTYLLTPIPMATYLAGSYPPRIQSPTATGGNLQFNWNALFTVLPVSYQAQFNTNLLTTNWNNLGPLLPGTNYILTGSDVISTNHQRFYRVVLQQ